MLELECGRDDWLEHLLQQAIYSEGDLRQHRIHSAGNPR